jgi:hypothetical protein
LRIEPGCSIAAVLAAVNYYYQITESTSDGIAAPPLLQNISLAAPQTGVTEPPTHPSPLVTYDDRPYGAPPFLDVAIRSAAEYRTETCSLNVVRNSIIPLVGSEFSPPILLTGEKDGRE